MLCGRWPHLLRIRETQHDVMCSRVAVRRWSRPALGRLSVIGRRWAPAPRCSPETDGVPRPSALWGDPISSAGYPSAGLQRPRSLAAWAFPASPHPLEMPPTSWPCDIFGVSSSSTSLSQEMRKCTELENQKSEQATSFQRRGPRWSLGRPGIGEVCPPALPPDAAGAPGSQARPVVVGRTGRREASPCVVSGQWLVCPSSGLTMSFSGKASAFIEPCLCNDTGACFIVVSH